MRKCYQPKVGTVVTAVIMESLQHSQQLPSCHTSCPCQTFPFRPSWDWKQKDPRLEKEHLANSSYQQALDCNRKHHHRHHSDMKWIIHYYHHYHLMVRALEEVAWEEVLRVKVIMAVLETALILYLHERKSNDLYKGNFCLKSSIIIKIK